MDSTILTLAFAAGLVAAVNPCGFAMLPAYVSFFLTEEADAEPTRFASFVRAIRVSLVVSLGFVVVFGLFGLAAAGLQEVIQEWIPYATIAIGIGLIGLAIAMFRGFELSARLPKLGFSKGRNDSAMFLYGISYAVASLSCTIGPFLGTVVVSFRTDSFSQGVGTLLAYAAGMGLVMMAVTVALALARDSVVGFLRTGMQKVNRISAALMLIMGAYVAWYGVFELRLRNDARATAGPVDWVEGWSTEITAVVQDVGPTRFGLFLALGVAVLGAAAYLVSTLRPSADDRSADEAGRAEERAEDPTPVG